MTRDAFKNKAELVLDEYNLPNWSDTSMGEYIAKSINEGSDYDDFLTFVGSLQNSLVASKKAEEIWDKETRDRLIEYVEAQGSPKEAKAWENLDKSLTKLKQEWDNSPAKVLANSELISKAMTMKNQHDYGRFVFNLLKEPENCLLYTSDAADE